MKTNSIYLLLLLLLCGALPLKGQGIVFSEYRVILNAQQLFTLQVCNPTQIVRSYQLLLEDKKMNASGKIEDIPDSLAFEQSLKKQIRIFPKRITLQPGECQAVQIQLKNTTSLPKGEFRSYLHFLPLVTTAASQADTTKRYASAVPSIAMRIGAAIPILFRKDTRLESLAIDSVRLNKEDKKHPVLSLTIHREGSQSTYGKVLISGRMKGKTVVVKELPGYAVMPEVNRRNIITELVCDGLDVDPSGKTPITIQYLNLEKDSHQEVLTQWDGEL